MAQRVLARLARLNQTAVFVGLGAFVFVGLVLPGPIGGLLLLALAAGAAWLLVQTWPLHPPGRRLVRLLVLGVLVALAVARLTD